MKIGYFPGCSLHATAREFAESLRAVAAPLGVELDEVEDWACCGATSAHATNHLLSVALPARTLALAEAQGFDRLLAPCAACYSRLAGAHRELAENAALLDKVRTILERPFTNKVSVLSIADWARVLIPEIKAKVTTPLTGLKVAAYYGCLLVRPHAEGGEDPEDPRSMEALVTALGGTPVEWTRKLDCCGGGFALSRTASVIRLGTTILTDAKAAGADAVVVGCPMCHSNLDFRQKAISKHLEAPLGMPILYLTQLMGLAMGIAPSTLGLERHFVSTEGLTGRLAAGTAPAVELPKAEVA